MTTREIDDLLFGLLGSVDGDARHLGFVEPAILIFDHCLREIGPEVCDQHIRFYSHSMMHALRPEVVPTLHYRVLNALPGVLERIAASSPEALPSDHERIGQAAAEALSGYRRLLGEESAGIGSVGPEGDNRTLPTRDTVQKVDLAMVWQYGRDGRDFSLGKKVGARLDLVIAGEWSLTRTFDPLVAFSRRIREHDDPFARQLRNAVAIAEDRFNRAGVREVRRLPREYLFRISEEDTPPDWLRLFTGGSAGLGLSLLALGTLDTMNVRRRQRVLHPDVMFTGEVDAAGKVVAVDQDGIAPKIEAAFYSPCRTFVLPRGNLDKARQSLQGLREKYPKRDLELLPVDSVDQAYEDGRVTSTKDVPPLKVIGAKVRRRRKTIAVGLAVLMSAVLAGILLPPRLAREIVAYDFDGGKVRFYNRYGYNFDEFDVPYYVKVVECDYSDVGAKSHRLILEDFDGDPSEMELLFISVESRRGRKAPQGHIHIHLFSNEGRLLRHVEAMDEIVVIYPDSTKIYTDFEYRFDMEEDLDGDGFKEVFISFSEALWWPSGILNMSLASGDYQCFLHRGHMLHFVTGDIDQNGEKEIIAVGRFNPDTSTVAAVLDPSHMHGMTPSPQGLEVPGFEEDVAMYYITFPRSDLSLECEGIGRPYPDRVIRHETGLLQVSVMENSRTYNRNAILYYISPDWRCAGIDYSDAYKESFALCLQGEENFVDRLDRQKERMKREFRYYTGAGYSITPIVNAGYLAARDNQHSAGGDSVRSQ